MKLWTSLLIATGTVMSFALTCITPFPAIAAFAAKTLPRRLAVVAVLGSLAGNQIVGYACLGYPHAPMTYAWGGFIALAALAALEAAARIAQPVLAFVASFAAYEAVIFVFSAATNTLGDFSYGAGVSVLEANLTGVAVLYLLRTGMLAAERISARGAAHAHR